MKIKRFVCNAFQENAYVVSEGADCIIIDPGFTSSELSGLYEYLAEENLSPSAILLTHSHPDHTCGLQALVERFGISVQSLQAETGAFPAEPFFGEDGNDAGAALYGFKVIATPGHTPDSVCYYNEAEHILFTGDTLFAGSIGRTDLPGGDYDSEIRSIMEKLIFLPGETDIYPGHGPASTIARERMENPFLEPFNEREEIEELN
ncbi:MAG: MBL fold metallo-hydrolase [Bacteroidales bacterium]|nr:MBL fold metallo-hydrolase [Bacteroidales bacterium]